MDRTFRVVAPNKIIELNDDVSIIRITRLNGEVIEFLIDSADVPLLRHYRWFSHMGYCCTVRYWRHWPLTWELLGRPPKGQILHHVNGDRSDNRRSNLRLIPRGANNYFKRVQPNRSTGIRGISRYANGSIVALVGTGGKRKYFNSIEEARKARECFENIMNSAIGPLEATRNHFKSA